MANPSGTREKLRPFPKGQSGNPGGRPRGLSITALIRRELEKPCPDDASVTQGERVAAVVVERAIAGEATFVTLIREYVDGNAVQPVRSWDGDAEIDRIAARVGVDVEELRAEYGRLVAGS